MWYIQKDKPELDCPLQNESLCPLQEITTPPHNPWSGLPHAQRSYIYVWQCADAGQVCHIVEPVIKHKLQKHQVHILQYSDNWKQTEQIEADKTASILL